MNKGGLNVRIVKLFLLGIVSIFKFILRLFKYFFIGLFNVIIFIPKYFVIGIIYIFKKDKRKKAISRQNKKLSFMIGATSFAIYLICVFLISKWSVQGLKIKYLSKDIVNSTEIVEKEEKNDKDENLTNENADNEKDNTSNNANNSNYTYYPNDYWDYMSVPFMEVNFDELLKKNPDTVGWIKVDGTKVNYPVVQSTDNSYYLSHAFNKSSNVGGWIFADYRDDFVNFDKNTIIYGHNMNNKTMFGSIPSMLYDSYLNKSSDYFIKISTPTSNSIWKVFSIYTIEPETYYIRTGFYTVNYGEWLDTIKGRSIYNFGIDVDENDRVLTLSTCDNTGTKRVAVHAKMINIEYK